MSKAIIKKLFYILALAFAPIGCKTTETSPPSFYHDSIRIPKDVVRNAWFEHLAENNIALYGAVIRATIISQKSDKEVFVGKRVKIDGINASYQYYTSFENPNGENVLSVIWSNREVRFDHYNNTDGKPMSYFADEYVVKHKTKKLHQQLELGKFN